MVRWFGRDWTIEWLQLMQCEMDLIHQGFSPEQAHEIVRR